MTAIAEVFCGDGWRWSVNVEMQHERMAAVDIRGCFYLDSSLLMAVLVDGSA